MFCSFCWTALYSVLWAMQFHQQFLLRALYLYFIGNEEYLANCLYQIDHLLPWILISSADAMNISISNCYWGWTHFQLWPRFIAAQSFPALWTIIYGTSKIKLRSSNVLFFGSAISKIILLPKMHIHISI